MTKLSQAERVGVAALILLAWWLRWVALMEVPAGWRDDDLIELYAFSEHIWETGPVLYLAGASGHEPAYHTLRAPLVGLAGVNQASARVMSAGAGTLAVVLTWAIGRRMLGRLPGFVAGTAMALSYWALMYSRFAVRHMGAVPWMVAAMYWGWRILRDRQPSTRRLRWMAVGLAIGTAGSLLTYYAGRVMPVLLLVAYFVAASRKRRWRTYFAGLVAGLLLAAPMFWAATHIVGGDARVSEVAGPLHALDEGDAGPLLRTIWTTLGMFHAVGDPEWLYNYAERPVFGPVGAVLFYGALALCLVRWRRPESRVLPLWVAAGMGPALLSYPPSSLGHTILALPGAMLLLASPVGAAAHQPAASGANRLSAVGPSRAPRRQVASWMLAIAVVVVPAARDLPDYFVDWAEHPMVRFLYRADYRALATGFCEDESATDIAVGSYLFGPWDKLAVETDCPRTSLRHRWFNPARALVFAGGRTTPLYLQDEGDRLPEIQTILDGSPPIAAPEGMQGFSVAPPAPWADVVRHDIDEVALADQPFEGALALVAAGPIPLGEGTVASELVMTWWQVTDELPLPPEEIYAYPPPPGVYTGPRLKVFAHLLDGDEVRSIDDGLWVDPYSLRPGDVVIQVHSFETGGKALDGPVTLQIGLYDPKTEMRWRTPSGADRLTVSLDR